MEEGAKLTLGEVLILLEEHPSARFGFAADPGLELGREGVHLVLYSPSTGGMQRYNPGAHFGSLYKLLHMGPSTYAKSSVPGPPDPIETEEPVVDGEAIVTINPDADPPLKKVEVTYHADPGDEHEPSEVSHADSETEAYRTAPPQDGEGS